MHRKTENIKYDLKHTHMILIQFLQHVFGKWNSFSLLLIIFLFIDELKYKFNYASRNLYLHFNFFFYFLPPLRQK